MPSYLYLCQDENDNHGEFEAVHPITEQLSECPQCKEKGAPAKAPKRLIAGSSFVLTGGGWASSGYSSK